MVILFSVLIAVAIGSGCDVPYQDKNINVGPFSTETLTMNSPKGVTIEGYLTVRGGNDEIVFYIKDSYGNVVLNIQVRGRYDFSYKTTSEGFHTLYFDNGSSLFASPLASKQILMHYRVR